MDANFWHLVEYVYTVSNSNALWQVEPHLVPKDASKYRIIMDLRPGNAAPASDAWKIPNIDPKLAELSRKTCFGTMHLCKAHWQIRLHHMCFDTGGIIIRQRVFASKQVLHCLKRDSTFPSTRPQCFHSMQKALKLCLDGFITNGREKRAGRPYIQVSDHV